MKKIFRILNVRKHKSVIFAETYTSDGKKEQIVFDKNLFSVLEIYLDFDN